MEPDAAGKLVGHQGRGGWRPMLLPEVLGARPKVTAEAPILRAHQPATSSSISSLEPTAGDDDSYAFDDDTRTVLHFFLFCSKVIAID